MKGGYWLHSPNGSDAVAYMGAIAPEALEAWVRLKERHRGLGLLAITWPDLLHREWTTTQRERLAGRSVAQSHIEALLAPFGRSARFVTVLDGSPSALSWIGSVSRGRVRPLGIDRFGQTGDLPDLYEAYGISAKGIEAAADAHFRI